MDQDICIVCHDTEYDQEYDQTYDLKKSRNFVHYPYTECNHNICKDCYNELLRIRYNRCPYCQKEYKTAIRFIKLKLFYEYQMKETMQNLHKIIPIFMFVLFYLYFFKIMIPVWYYDFIRYRSNYFT